MENEVRSFAEQFFMKIGCEVRSEGKLMGVDKVPEKFESFVGKRGPFVFSFDEVIEGAEVLKKGGYFLNAMANYLQTASKITLIKLKVPLEAEQEILSRFSFPNASIREVRSEFKYEKITRFLFNTRFQYLNEREHQTVSVFVKDGKIFEIDPMQLYEGVEGNKKDIEIPDFTGEYNLAREVVKKKVEKEVEKISDELGKRLEKEIERIELHHKAQLNELEESQRDLTEQIARLEADKKGERDKIAKRIEKLRADLQSFNVDEKKKIFEQDRELAMKEEKAKHKLNVGHQLINTSVIYYPIFNLNVSLVNERAKGRANIVYDPVQKYMAPLVCPATGMAIYSVYLDDAGVLCSKESIAQCFESGKYYCSTGLTVKCAHSGRMIHSSNAGRCAVSGKSYGRSYLKEDSFNGAKVYANLLKFCPSCLGHTQEKNFVKCPSCGTSVCSRDLKKTFVEGRVITHCLLCRK